MAFSHHNAATHCSRDLIPAMNDNQLQEMRGLIDAIISKTSAKSVLDLTTTGLLGLWSVRNSSQSRLSLAMTPDEDDLKERVDGAWALMEGLNVPADVISWINLDELEGSNEEFDICILDPISRSGRIRTDLMPYLDHVLTHLSNDAVILPQDVEIFVQLVESEAISNLGQVRNDLESLNDLGIAQGLNKYQVHHLQGIDLRHYEMKLLSSATSAATVSSFLLGNELEFSGQIKATSDGSVHACLYFFHLRYDEKGRIISSFDCESVSSFYKQSLFRLSTPIKVRQSENLKYSLKMRKGVLGIDLE